MGGDRASGARAAGMILGGVPFGQAEAERTILAYAAAGIRAFLLPGAVLRDAERAASLAALARRAVEEAGTGRALVAAGGGLVARFGSPYLPEIPTPLCLAAGRSPRAARRAGRLLGEFVAAAGMDMVLAPRLGLAIDPKDSSGAVDLFGADPRSAGILGAAYARGVAEGGAAACVGRFPGLGSTCCAEGGEAVPLVDVPIDRLEACEMKPFARAVFSGAAAVLVGRALVPALETERIPASRSERVIGGKLRGELGFRGIVVGDDGREEADKGRAALLGVLAGCDLCMFSKPADALEAAAALERAAASGELSSTRVERASRRIDDALPRTGSRNGGGSPHPSALLRAARDREAGFCLLCGSLVLDAARSGSYKGVLVVLFSPPPGSPEAEESSAAAAALRAGLPGAHIVEMRSDPEPGDAEALTRTIERAGGYSEAAILSYDAHFRPAQESMIRFVEESVPRLLVIAMRDPYDAAFFPRAAGLGAALGFSADAAKTAIRHLTGSATARGHCPVPVIGLEV